MPKSHYWNILSTFNIRKPSCLRPRQIVILTRRAHLLFYVCQWRRRVSKTEGDRQIQKDTKGAIWVFYCGITTQTEWFTATHTYYLVVPVAQKSSMTWLASLLRWRLKSRYGPVLFHVWRFYRKMFPSSFHCWQNSVPTVVGPRPYFPLAVRRGCSQLKEVPWPPCYAAPSSSSQWWCFKSFSFFKSLIPPSRLKKLTWLGQAHWINLSILRSTNLGALLHL